MASEARSILDMLAAAWEQCEKAQLELRRAEGVSAGSGELEIRVAVLLDAMMQAETALVARLNECRDALAMADAIGVTLHDFTREGVTGKAMDWLRAHFEGRKDVLAADLERPVATLRARIAEMAVLPTLTSMAEDELTAMLESVAVTGYTVPAASATLPNWLNVKCALAVVERQLRQVGQMSALAPPQRAELAAKLRRVQMALFNSDALRFPRPDALAARHAKREEFKGVLGVVTDELLDNADFVTAIELAQTTFREVLTLFAHRYRLLVVEGDGNCFFRAVVKGLTPHMPRDFEDALSLQLRRSVNRSAAAVEQLSPETLHEFEVADESDPRTMAQAGVWADHVQMAKVASFLHRPVWLLRCDDRELRMGADGLLTVSPHYRIGPTDSALAPVSLFYQTTPGHFETMVTRDDTTLQDALDAKPSTLLSVCDCWFRIEEAQSDLERLAARGADVSNDWDVRQSVKLDVEDRAARLESQLRAFQSHLRALPAGASALTDDAAHVLFGDLFDQLVLDSDSGPMAQLRDRLELCKAQLPLAGSDARPVPAAVSPPQRDSFDPYPHNPFPSGAPLYSLKGHGNTSNSSHGSAARVPHGDDTDMIMPLHSRRDRPAEPDYFPAKGARGAEPDYFPAKGARGAGETATQLMRNANATLDDWLGYLEANGGAAEITVAGLTVDAKALKMCFDAFEARQRAGSKVGVHMSLQDCVLDDACCDLLKGKCPRLVTLIKLSKCKFPQAFVTWFKVKQHMQVEDCTQIVPVE